MSYKSLISFLFLICLIPNISLAQEGKIILDLQEDKEIEPIDFIGLYNEYMQELDFFDKKYPEDAINQDFEEDLWTMHPDYSDSWLSNKQSMLRIGIRARRTYRNIKQKIQDLILENDIPLQFDDDEYEMGEDEVYQETDKPLIIVDIKKAIAYSKSPRDQQIIKDKINRDMGLPTDYEVKQKMKKALLEKDWKTLFSYGLFDGIFLKDNRGVGNWYGTKDVSARINSIKKYLDDKQPIMASLQIDISPDLFLLRRDYGDYKGIEVDFSASENIKDIKLNWPIPQRRFLDNKNSIVGYSQKIDIPFYIEPISADKRIMVRAKIKTAVCHNEKCKNITINPVLQIGVALENDQYINHSLADMSIKQSHQKAPKEQLPDLMIEDLYVEETPQGQQLVLVSKYKGDIKSFDAYIEGEGGEEFTPPLITFNQDYIESRFIPKNNTIDIKDKEYSCMVSISNHQTLRQKLKAKDQPWKSTDTVSNFAKYVIFALGIGLILNLSPTFLLCWNTKINLFNEFGGSQVSNVKEICRNSLLGILVGGFIGIICFSIVKMLDINLIWGMQFQSKILILTAIFSTWFAILYFADLLKINSRYIVIIGSIWATILLIFFPFPYLTDIMSQSLALSFGKALTLLIMILVGISVPVCLLYFYPEMVLLFSRIQRHYLTFHKAKTILLWSMLFWLITILAIQTSLHLFWHLGIFFILSSAILFIKKLTNEQINDQDVEPQIREQASKRVNLFAWAFLVLLMLLMTTDVKNNFSLNSDEENIQNSFRTSKIELLLEQKRNILVKVTADWCLRCLYNEYMVFNQENIKNVISDKGVVELNINWDPKNPDLWNIMQEFKQNNLPLYILYSPNYPQGLVLPKNINQTMMFNLLKNLMPQ